MIVVEYLRELTEVFFRWWWAVVTGIASILGLFIVPETGFNLSRTTISLLILFGLMIFFFLISVLFRSFNWFAKGRNPNVTKYISTPDDGHPCKFVIALPYGSASQGGLLSVYREVNGENICIAILRYDCRHSSGKNIFQYVPIAIKAGHLADLKKGKTNISELIVKTEVPETAVAMIQESDK